MSHFPIPSFNNFTGWFDYINNVTTTSTVPGSEPVALFGVSILMMIFFISFFSLKGYPTEKAGVTALFITIISSFFLSILGLVNGFISISLVALFLLSIFILWKGDLK